MGNVITFEPHNWYLTMYLRIGLIGLVAYCLVFAGAIVTLLVRRYTLEAAVLLALALYSWVYTVNWYLAPVLAFALLAVRSPQVGTPLSTDKPVATAKQSLEEAHP
jgi:O-antigen ligase